MIQNPLISIIVPIYNVADYLPRCLDSICKQTYQNLEIILVDDGSSDNSLEICKKYATKDSRIRVISQENRSISTARNIGLKTATGEFISFVDGDDWLSQNFYKELLTTALAQGVLVTAGHFWHYYPPSLYARVHSPHLILPPSTQNLKPEDFFLLCLRLMETSPCGKLYRSQSIRSYFFNPDYQYAEDLDFFSRSLFEKQLPAAYCQQAVYYYTQRPLSLVRTQNPADKKIGWDIWTRLVKFADQQHFSLLYKELLAFLAPFTTDFIFSLVLLDTSDQYPDRLREIHAWTKKHQSAFFKNNQIFLLGKLFLLFFILSPKVLTSFCRLSVFHSFLLKRFERIIHPPLGKLSGHAIIRRSPPVS